MLSSSSLIAVSATLKAETAENGGDEGHARTSSTLGMSRSTRPVSRLSRATRSSQRQATRDPSCVTDTVPPVYDAPWRRTTVHVLDKEGPEDFSI